MPFEISPLVEVPPPKAAPTKLSEGIRLGCKIAPQQCFDNPFDCEDGDTLAACALGAYALARGVKWGDWDGYSRVLQGFDSDLLTEIAHRWNDTERLTREEIADRLEARGL